MQSPVNACIQHLATTIGNSQSITPHSKHRAKHAVGCGSLPCGMLLAIYEAGVVIFYAWAFFWEGESGGYGSRSYSSTKSYSSTASQRPIILSYCILYSSNFQLSVSSCCVCMRCYHSLFAMLTASQTRQLGNCRTVAQPADMVERSTSNDVIQVQLLYVRVVRRGRLSRRPALHYDAVAPLEALFFLSLGLP